MFAVTDIPHGTTWQHLRILLLAIPVFLVGFGYHAVVPSFMNYLGPDPKRLRKVIWTGTTVSLVIYIAWLSVSFLCALHGANGLLALHHNGDHVAQFLLQLQHV